MDIITDTSEFYLDKETAVAIGKFDGVHLGHRRLLDEILAQKKRGLSACVFTFNPPPAVLFGGDAHVINTDEEKRILLERMGVDILVEFPLNAKTAATNPTEFITEYLVEQMNMSFIAAGKDISFGDKGKGDYKLLEKLAPEYGYEIKIIDKVRTEENEEISSSLVRKYIEAGDMKKVEMLLGREYSLSGEIVHGNHIGSTLGFPTINVYPNENKVLPPFGVYKSQALIDGKIYKSLSNIGCKPTIGGETKPSIESFIYDFDMDVYGKETTIFLGEFKRPERRFAGLEELKAQLKRDIEEARV